MLPYAADSAVQLEDAGFGEFGCGGPAAKLPEAGDAVIRSVSAL